MALEKLASRDRLGHRARPSLQRSYVEIAAFSCCCAAFQVQAKTIYYLYIMTKLKHIYQMSWERESTSSYADASPLIVFGAYPLLVRLGEGYGCSYPPSWIVGIGLLHDVEETTTL